jgi:ParB-like chromosome segregation protein Spo0J
MEQNTIKILPIEKIRDPFEKNRDDRVVANLVKDIKRNGLRHPLWVDEKEDGFFNIIDGSHRLAAIKILGWKEVKCQVTDLRKMQHPHP